MKKDNSFEENPSGFNTWLNDHLEAYMDGELAESDSKRIDDALQTHEHLQEELTLAINIRDELRSLRSPSCPTPVTSNVLNTVRKDAWTTFTSKLKHQLLGAWITHWKPVLVTLTILFVTTFILLKNPSTTSPSPDQITQAEIDQALGEVKWTLGYVSKTGRLTGSSVQDALAPLLNDLSKE